MSACVYLYGCCWFTDDGNALKMPSVVRVIGTAEEGGELRVWTPEGDISLALMKFAWFRTFAAAARLVHCHIGLVLLCLRVFLMLARRVVV